MKLVISEVRSLLRPLRLSNKQLLEISQSFAAQLACGVLEPESDAGLKVFPTFITDLPTGQETGNFLALDLGGSNFRVLLTSLAGNSRSTVKTQTFSVPQKFMKGSGEELFDYIAGCLVKFVAENDLLGKHLPLGFTFSFPCSQTSKSEATLSQWTKGFSASGVVGKDVGKLLARALDKYNDVDIKIVAIVNDTAGTLMSCAYQDPDCRIGFIVGTGANACYMEESLLSRPMIINTELGAFGSRKGANVLPITPWDAELDRKSINPGGQIFEKMISGMYLGEIVRLFLVDLLSSNEVSFDAEFVKNIAVPDSFKTSFISEVELDSEDQTPMINTAKVLQQLGVSRPVDWQCQLLHLVCSTVSTRAAHLVAAVLATMLAHIGRPATTVGFDGTVYRCHPHFRSKVEEKTRKLLDAMDCSAIGFRFMLSEDGSGLGAALTASISGKSDPGTISVMACSRCRADIRPLRQWNDRDCPRCLQVAN